MRTLTMLNSYWNIYMTSKWSAVIKLWSEINQQAGFGYEDWSRFYWKRCCWWSLLLTYYAGKVMLRALSIVQSFHHEHHHTDNHRGIGSSFLFSWTAICERQTVSVLRNKLWGYSNSLDVLEECSLMSFYFDVILT